MRGIDLVPLAWKASAVTFVLLPRWGNGELMTTEDFLCYCNGWTESFIAYRSKFGFVDSAHQSMCFSGSNRWPFRMRYLTGGVQRSCLCQKDVFDSLICRVMFPSTSIWGKPWRFGAPIALSASSVLFHMLPFPFCTYMSMSFFGQTK